MSKTEKWLYEKGKITLRLFEMWFWYTTFDRTSEVGLKVTWLMKYVTEENEVVKCLECGDEIAYGGRADRKFCCNSCKNRYNNKRTRNSKRRRMKILNSIDKNYSILEKLIRAGIREADVMELKDQGFDFDSVTSYRKIRRHDVFCCYDISFSVILDRVVSITRREGI